MIRGVLLRESDIWVDRERNIRKGPQVGRQFECDWPTFKTWLSTPKAAPFKDSRGAWVCSDIEGGFIKGGIGAVSLFPGDVDKCGPGGMARSARALQRFAGVLVPTFSYAPQDERHRFALLPDRIIETDEFPVVWLALERHCARAGVVIDNACKNANRLYYPAAMRDLAAWPGAIDLTGEPFSVEYYLNDEHEHQEHLRAAARATYTPLPIGNVAKKVEVMIRNGCAAIAVATPGDRHPTLIKKARSLALEGLPVHAIEDALLPAFVSVAGQARRKEGIAAIKWAVST